MKKKDMFWAFMFGSPLLLAILLVYFGKIIFFEIMENRNVFHQKEDQNSVYSNSGFPENKKENESEPLSSKNSLKQKSSSSKGDEKGKIQKQEDEKKIQKNNENQKSIPALSKQEKQDVFMQEYEKIKTDPDFAFAPESYLVIAYQDAKEFWIKAREISKKYNLPLSYHHKFYLFWKEQRIATIKDFIEARERRERWGKNPELAFEEVEKMGKNWNQALSFIDFEYPNRLIELRSRVIDKLPQKELGGSLHLNILNYFLKRKLPLSEDERNLLIEKGWFNPDSGKITQDETGDVTLQIIAQFPNRNMYQALLKLCAYFPHRIPELRSIANSVSKEHWGKLPHARILQTLITYGIYVSEEEKKIVENLLVIPTPEIIQTHTKHLKKILEEHKK